MMIMIIVIIIIVVVVIVLIWIQMKSMLIEKKSLLSWSSEIRLRNSWR